MYNIENEKTNLDLSNMSLAEIKTLINEKMDILAVNICDHEKANSEKKESLFEECKIILLDIQKACDEITSKYKESLSLEEYNEYMAKSNIIKENKDLWKSFALIGLTYIGVLGAYIPKENKGDIDINVD